jgi:hypothetical protein
MNTLGAIICQKCGRPKELAPIKVWFVHEKFGNRWLEYNVPINLIDHPSNMKMN